MDGKKTDPARDELVGKLRALRRSLDDLLPTRLSDTAAGLVGTDAAVASLRTSGSVASIGSGVATVSATLANLPQQQAVSCSPA